MQQEGEEGQSPRKLVWNARAIEDINKLLARRQENGGDVDRVFDCVESNLLNVANNPESTQLVPGPLRERIFRFLCNDGVATVPLVAVFIYAPKDEIGLVRLMTQEF